MVRDFASTECRYCVRLATLIRHLKEISLGPHQWAMRPVSGIFVSINGEVARYVVAGYSNPKASGLPNNLVFGIPLNIHRGDAEASPELIVCFDPSSVIALLRGLYWTGSTFEYDPARDWDRFWSPVAAVVAGTVAINGVDGRTVKASPDEGGQTLDGISYTESIASCLKWWAHCQETLQSAIYR
ncbi:MAG TPA: hypothetical protein VFC39_06025 [Acidobacteriaceae bacterium]|nr:hypothetical protein [Acidobacteriaceae bacterium]